MELTKIIKNRKASEIEATFKFKDKRIDLGITLPDGNYGSVRVNIGETLEGSYDKEAFKSLYSHLEKELFLCLQKLYGDVLKITQPLLNGDQVGAYKQIVEKNKSLREEE